MSDNENGNGNSRKAWVYAQLEENVHTALLTLATQEGKHVRAVVQEAIERHIMAHARETASCDPKIAAAAMRIESRARATMMDIVKEIAYAHMEHQDEASADALEEICKIAQVQVDAILGEVSSSPKQASVVVGNSPVLRSVERWLMALLREYGSPVRAGDVLAEGQKRGFDKQAINMIKRQIGLISRKQGAYWYWYTPDSLPLDSQDGVVDDAE